MATNKKNQDVLTEEIQEVTEKIKKEKGDSKMKKGIKEQLEESKEVVSETIQDVKNNNLIEEVKDTIDNNPVILFSRALTIGDLSTANKLQKELDNLTETQQEIALKHDMTLCRYIPNLNKSLQLLLISMDIRYGILIQNIDPEIKAQAIYGTVIQLNKPKENNINNISHPGFNIGIFDQYSNTHFNQPMFHQPTQFKSIEEAESFYNRQMLMNNDSYVVNVMYTPEGGWNSDNAFIQIQVSDDYTLNTTLGMDVDVCFMNLMDTPTCNTANIEEIKNYVKQVLDFCKDEPKVMNV